MQRSTPQPDDFDARQKARQPGLARPRPPRVIVSGDEAEDASEWEVVVVENEAIDDQRALEIARQRHQQQRLANLPSLDERDIAQALGIGAEGEAEAADGIDADAFVLPGDTPPARRITGPAPLPVGLIFDGVEEPGEEDEAAETRFPLDEPVEHAESFDDVRFEEPEEAAEVTPEAAAEPDAAPPEADPEGEQHLPVTSWNPAPLEPRVTFDDVDLGFYDIGDEAIDVPVIGGGVAEAAPEEADAGLERDEAHVPADDPHHDFYAVDDKDPVTALEPPKPKEVVPPTEPVKLWGTGRAKQVDGKVYAPGEVPHDEVVPEEEDDDFASSFPIDPDEFLTEEGAEVAVDELDYASVFGPVDAPPALAPVPVAAPVHDVDPMEVAAHAPITESPARRRRRKAAAAGATASGVVAKGRKAKAEAAAAEIDQFEDLRPQAGESETFEDLAPIETDDTEWGWRDEFVEDDPTAVGGAHPEHIHAGAGYAYAYDDDEFYDATQPLLVDQRPRHIREDAQPRRGRRELVALGAAALVVLAVGVGSRVFNDADRPEFVKGSDAPTTTKVERATTSTSTTLNPFGTGILTVPDGSTDGAGGLDGSVTTKPGRTTSTTVKKGATPPPVVSSTTTSTTAPTTTEPPTTTTTEPPPPSTTTTEVQF